LKDRTTPAVKQVNSVVVSANDNCSRPFHEGDLLWDGEIRLARREAVFECVNSIEIDAIKEVIDCKVWPACCDTPAAGISNVTSINK
jgi:hypothetical protein